MDDVKIYKPTEIPDTSFPQEMGEMPIAQSVSEYHTPTEIPDTKFPEDKIATELISASLNTKSKKILGEYQFTKYGALQIGVYILNESGDIKISPAGILAKNKHGAFTFVLDGDSGDATFAGIVRAATFIGGSIITGQIDVGLGGGGAYVRLDGANNRMVVHDGTNPRIVVGNI